MRRVPSEQPEALILASASPRRAVLLRKAGIAFERRPANIDESRIPGETPERHVLRLAESKARAVWRAGTRALGADTVVVLDHAVLGKPSGAAQAARMLTDLSGRIHHVLTGVALFDGRHATLHCEETQVEFRALSVREISDYVSSGEPLDKAGAYGIQGGAAKFVERIEGSYSNVVGLPLEAVRTMVR